MGIARFDTMFLVQSKNSTRQPGGSEQIPNYTDKFSLRGSFVKQNTRKVLESGVLVNITNFLLTYRYQNDKSITISDLVIINGESYTPVGDCVTDSEDHPRFFSQLLTKHG